MEKLNSQRKFVKLRTNKGRGTDVVLLDGMLILDDNPPPRKKIPYAVKLCSK